MSTIFSAISSSVGRLSYTHISISSINSSFPSSISIRPTTKSFFTFNSFNEPINAFPVSDSFIFDFILDILFSNLALSEALDTSTEAPRLYVRNDSDGQEGHPKPSPPLKDINRLPS